MVPDIVAYAKTVHAKYPLVGMADLIQFMAKIGIVTCPLGPRMMQVLLTLYVY
jgi:hypothetical protein